MKSYRMLTIVVGFVTVVIALTGCEVRWLDVAALSGTATTTPYPSATKSPSPTLDMTATQHFIDLFEKLQPFSGKGYIDALDGEIIELNLLQEDWLATPLPYNDGFEYTWKYDGTLSDFMFKTHIDWSSDGDTIYDPDCGVIFGRTETSGYGAGLSYSEYVDMTGFPDSFQIGESINVVSGTYISTAKRINDPGSLVFTTRQTEADYAILVMGIKAYVSLNGDIREYLLFTDPYPEGGFSILRSFRDNEEFHFYTGCEMTDMVLWIPR